MSLIRRGNVFDPFSLDLWDPFQGFPLGSGSSSRLFPRTSSDSETASFVGARIDRKETPETHVFKADVPGLKKEEVKMEISGERSKEYEEKNDKWHRVERSSGKFMRRFRLPENAKTKQIKVEINGERNKEHEEKNNKWHRVERSSGKFMRRFRLPENAKTEQIKASTENGGLTVTMPKEEVKKPEVKSIQISS